jgi:tetratricopeptide (TPR) repeat protein
MKHSMLSFLLVVLVSGGLMAQGAKRTTAYNYMMEEKLDKALENIEPTIEHPKTSAEDKTWRYRGQIYSMIASTKVDEYKNLHPEPVIEAARSYRKAMELDTKDSYRKENLQALAVVQQQANFYGGTRFSENSFKSSYENFKLAAELAELLGVTDTIAIYNAGLAAERGEMYNEALEQYEKSMELGYLEGKMYVFVAMLHEKLGNEDKYMEVVQAGRKAFPGDADLIRMELNHYLVNEKYAEAENNLKLAIEKDANDKSLHFALGVVYDNLGKMDEAESAYKKAIELDANYFDALYNLGALYFNNAVELNKEANETSDMKKYQALRDEATALFVKAEPFLDRARALQPDDRNTLVSLRQLYAFTNQTEKYNAIKAEMGE